MKQTVVSDCVIKQIGFVFTLSDGSPLVCFWGFDYTSGGECYTVGQLRDISDKYWADKTPPRLELNSIVDLEERRISKQR